MLMRLECRWTSKTPNIAAISIPEGVSISGEVSTVGESGKSSPCNEDGCVSLEASPSSDPDGEASPGSGEASFRGVFLQSGATNGTSFTDEQLELLEKSLEEGYELFVDADYVRWLEMHHPATPSGILCQLPGS